MANSETNITTICIPTLLFKKIEERIKGTDFTSVSDYVAYVLREVISEEEKEQAFSKEEEEQVKEKLRNLGYFD